MKVLLTSGGTKIPIDKVRHIGNMSKGTFPTKIAWEGMKTHKWDLNFIYSEGSKAPHLLEVDLMDDFHHGQMMKVHEGQIELMRIGNRYKPDSYKDFDTYVSILNSRIKKFNPDVIV